jgi:hypothetical protein
VQYLHHLEIPFFLGVVDQVSAELRIYSAERFPMMTAVFGLPEKLWLRPVNDDDPRRAWDGIDAKSGVTLNCYHVCTFTASERRDDLQAKVAQLLKLCRRAVANIGTRRAEEHIYQMDDDAKNFSIVAGCGSVSHFRDNIYKRLAEAFYNFEYMLNREPGLFDLSEFHVYETFHLALMSGHSRESLHLAHKRYRQVKSIVRERYPNATSDAQS